MHQRRHICSSFITDYVEVLQLPWLHYEGVFLIIEAQLILPELNVRLLLLRLIPGEEGTMMRWPLPLLL